MNLATYSIASLDPERGFHKCGNSWKPDGVVLETNGNVKHVSCDFNLFIENTRLTVVFRMYQSETSVNS